MTGVDLSVAEAAGRIRCRPNTILNWIKVGVQVGGRRVRLAGRRVGGRYRITEAAIEQFVADCNPTAPPPAESPAARSKRLADGKREALALTGGLG